MTSNTQACACVDLVTSRERRLPVTAQRLPVDICQNVCARELRRFRLSRLAGIDSGVEGGCGTAKRTAARRL